MVEKPIIWSPRAQKDRMEILKYWINRNKSTLYAEKLIDLIEEATKLITKHPNLGRATNLRNVRFKVIRDYLLFYEEMDDRIEILLFWDSRQDPDNLDTLLVSE